MRLRTSIAAIAVLLSILSAAEAADPNDMFIVRTTSKSPEDLVAAIKSYSEGQRWRFVGADKVKQGQVVLVKICIPDVGRLVWPLGLRLSALLPCGNMRIYANGTVTEVSLLHPAYMHMLYPDPALERASAIAEPLLSGMLDAVTK
jgi:hypothetical protein